MTPDLSHRIYCVNPLLVEPAGWPGLLDHCSALGFDHVLLAHPDGMRVSSDQIVEGMTCEALSQECASRNLRLLIDIGVGSVALDDTLLQQAPDWFDTPFTIDADLPDPRYFDRRQSRARWRWEDPAVADAALAWWSARLQALTGAGVAGFVCRDPAAVPAAVWAKLSAPLRADHACCHLLAWTPGVAAGDVAALHACDFDATFDSGAWWDFRSDWWAQEQQRLRAVAPPISFPEDPYGVRLARHYHLNDVPALHRASRRALWFAAATGNGWLVPMGFEYALQAPLFGGYADAAAYRLACAQSETPAGGIDLRQELRAANRFVAETGAQYRGAALRLLSAPHAPVAVIERRLLQDPLAPSDLPPLLISINSDLSDPRAGDVAIDAPPVPAPIATVNATARNRRSAVAGVRLPRIAIEAVSPAVDAGRFPVKSVIGDRLAVEADILIDGHDKLAARLLWRAADSRDWSAVPMAHRINDRWQALLPLQRVGRHFFAVEAWLDEYATYRDGLEKKSRAGLDLALELEEGRLLVVKALDHVSPSSGVDAKALKELARDLAAIKSRDKEKQALHSANRTERLLEPATAALMERHLPRLFTVRTEVDYPVDAQRPAARFSSWYELFPRSASGDEHRHGTFADVIGRLPTVAAMGFDTLYFPPIHPIGQRNRKGRNNSLTPDASDPGSPYAIGGEAGGHDAIHPELGTLADFQALRIAAAAHGLELALDFAIQCSPDHPWLQEHPDWFAWRPDGSMRYAENPPKKYEDIVNVDFYAAGAVPDLWIALRDVVLFWAQQGVRVFRVDNPHTKPLPFWEWMIGDIIARFPDTLFLSEAFTRPKMMYRLAKVGFSQSYTYFTWRHARHEFVSYLTELNQPPVRDFFRPNFFVNTPDINPYFLQRSGRPGFLIRAALAATLSGLWGVYSGFELCEAQAMPGKEEYLDSEKYQIRAWDWQAPGNIVAEITQLNQLRRSNPALQTHTGITFLQAGNDNLLAFVKATAREETGADTADGVSPFGDNAVLVVINLDPFNTQSGTLELPLWRFGLPDDGALAVEDLVRGHRFDWFGKQQQITLAPQHSPYAIWRIRPRGI